MASFGLNRSDRYDSILDKNKLADNLPALGTKIKRIPKWDIPRGRTNDPVIVNSMVGTVVKVNKDKLWYIVQYIINGAILNECVRIPYVSRTRHCLNQNEVLNDDSDLLSRMTIVGDDELFILDSRFGEEDYL